MIERAGDARRGFYYDTESHVYHIGRTRVPSVTQALVETGRIETRWFNEGAAERGRAVHRFTVVLDALGTLKGHDVPGDIGAEVEAYRAFRKDCRPTFVATEQARWHVLKRFAGRPDRIVGLLAGVPGGVLEIKTGEEAEWHEFQTAGYVQLEAAVSRAANGPRWALYLGKNARYKLRRLKNPRAHPEFDRALWETWHKMGRAITV